MLARHQRHCHGLFALSNCRCCFACIVAVAVAVAVALVLLLLFMALCYEFEICVLMNCKTTHINTIAPPRRCEHTHARVCECVTVFPYFLFCLSGCIYGFCYYCHIRMLATKKAFVCTYFCRSFTLAPLAPFHQL